MARAVSTNKIDVLHQALFEAVEVSDAIKPLVDLFLYQTPRVSDGNPKDQRLALLGAVATLTKASARRFFDGMRNILKRIVDDELFVPESAYADEGGDGEGEQHQVIVSDAQSALALSFVKVTAHCMESYMHGLVERRGDSSTRTISVVEEVFEVMERLHSCLIPLQASGDDGLLVQQKISSLCESWWKHNFQDRECMVVQLLPLLVAKSLDESATKADISRLVGMRHALDVLDFDDESSADIKSLLTRTVSSPLYIKTTEGKKLISCLFDHIPTDLHQAVRVQIPDAKRTTLAAYGEIYFRVWKESQNSDAIEEIILQDFCYAIVHVGNANMVKSLHTILEPFHKGQASQPVKDLLHRLYGPLLWRSLRAANPRVRVNAALLLGAVFPLADGVSMERAVQKGTSALKFLLQDTDPRVRVAGSEATATVLVSLWVVLPAADIRALLNHIVAEHASDASSSAVRVGAVNAISMLLDATESHAVLRALLPGLGNLIHDKVERVRLAVVRLLAKIKTIPGIKYYHVIPVHHLLARLVEEGRPPKNLCNPVASALTNLMMNSYFPQNVPTADQVSRTVSFLSSDPQAAAVFYSNISAHLAVNSVSKLAAMLLRCLVVAVQADTSGNKENRKRRRYGSQHQHDDEKEERQEQGEDLISAANTGLMASLAETICRLWESIESDLQAPENEPSLDFLVNAFSGAVLANVNSHFEEKAYGCDQQTRKGLTVMDDCHRVCAAILRCAGRLPPESVKGLAHQITSKLGAIENDSDVARQNITPHVALLCLWGMTEDVAASLASSIANSFGSEQLTFEDEIKGKKRRSQRLSKGSTVQTDTPLLVPHLPSHVAMEVLECILRGSDPSSAAARDAILSSCGACLALEKALEMGKNSAERLLLSAPIYADQISASDVELMLRACETSGRFALHKEASHNGVVTLSAQAKAILVWTTERVVPVLCGHSYRIHPTPFRDLDLSRISTVPDTPGSPEPLPSRHKRTDRKKTPQKMDSTFQMDKMVIDASFTHDIHVFSRGAAISLLQSSCVIFSEWLAVGGTGATEIAQAATVWCEVFANQDRALQVDLVPTFLRLAVHVAKISSNFSVLGRLLVTCDEADEMDETTLFKKTMVTLLTGRDQSGNSMLEGLLEETLKAVRIIIDDEGPTNNLMLSDPPSSWEEVCGFKRGCVVTVLSAVGSNKKACVALADMLVAALQKGPDENVAGEMVLFQVRCLWFLCEAGPDQGVTQKSVRSLSGKCRFEAEVQDAVEALTSFYT